MPAITVIKHRRDTAANWTSANPVLNAGEFGVESDTGAYKIGDGTTAWVSLQYPAPVQIKHYIKNGSGSSMTKGQVVYITGATGDNALVGLADADAEGTSSKTLGLLAQNLANNGLGYVVTEGLLTGVNTGSATAGNSVWLSTTPGGFVFGTPPAKPAHAVYLGVVTRAHSVNGEILIKVQNGYELEELHNVSITNPATGDVLTYDSTSGLWLNAQGGTGSASITVSDTAPADPQADSMWWNSAEGTAYIRYDSTWVPLSPGIAGPAGPTGIIVSDTAPTNTAQLWADPNATGSYVVPANGSKGQVLTKITDSSYDTGWATPQGSGNAIINGAFDVWQRGTSFTASGYTADRWTGDFVTGAGSITRQAFTPGTAPVAGYEGSYFLRRSVTTGAQFSSLIHRIEDVRTFAGQTVTLSFWAKGTNAPGNYAVNLLQNFGSGGSAQTNLSDQFLVVTSSWARYSFTFTLGSISGKTIGADNFLWLSIYQSATGTAASTLDIWGVQLEQGSIATPFRRNSPNIQAELAACQRYYYRRTGGAYETFATGIAVNTVTARFFFQPPVTMRTGFTSFDWKANLAAYDDVGVSINPISSPALDSAGTGNFHSVQFNSSVTLTAGRFLRLIANNDATAYIGFSAEL